MTKDAKELLKKQIEGTATDEEKSLLDGWYYNWREEDPTRLTTEHFENAKLAVLKRLPDGSGISKSIKIWPRIAAAVAIVMVLATVLYFTKTFRSDKNSEEIEHLMANDIASGKHKARLKLGDGKTILLSDTKTGVVIDAGNVIYNDGTAITTSANDVTLKDHVTQFATISTPRGGMYQIVLPDETKVWLNATSTLEFPSTFAHLTKRRVKLTGEAYFEVAKDKSHPFIVETGKQTVEVLGTHFNINAYDNEPAVKTTLLEGQIIVRHAELATRSGINKETILNPGEQATLNDNNIVLKKVNAEEATAWKDGLFMFDDESLENIMKKVERWYNVEVIYKNVNMNYKYGGGVSRYDNISVLLDKLEEAGEVQFKTSGRKIYVTKK